MQTSWATIFFDLPDDSFAAGSAFWGEVTGSRISAARGVAGEFATLLPGDGEAYLRVQRVPSGAGGVHLDLHLDLDHESLVRATERAITLGARLRHRDDDLVVLVSPGGFPFCLVGWDGETVVPDPIRLPGGGGSRLDQLALDVPPDLYEAESAFWAALTGWTLRPSGAPEFTFLEAPTTMPIRLLLQRLDQADPGAQVTGHVDLACTDATALSARHVELGARIKASFSSWITLTDPSGHLYCLTRRAPR